MIDSWLEGKGWALVKGTVLPLIVNDSGRPISDLSGRLLHGMRPYLDLSEEWR